MGARWILTLAVACLLIVPAASVHRSVAVAPLSIADMEQRVAAASRVNPPWDGPRSGPAGVEEKRIALVCEDLRNGGILGVAQGVREAAGVMQWQVNVFDAGGTPAGRDRAAVDALASAPDGLILVGADAKVMAPRLALLADLGVPMVGWHVGLKAGPMVDSQLGRSSFGLAGFISLRSLSRSAGSPGHQDPSMGTPVMAATMTSSSSPPLRPTNAS